MEKTHTARTKPTCNVCEQPATIYEEVYDCRLGQYVLKKVAFKTPKFKAEIYKCHNCSHYFLYGLDNSNFYDEEYSEWQGAQGYFGQLKKSAEIKIQKIYKHLGLKDSIGFLDIGCGVGEHLELASNYFNNIFGIEPSSNAQIAQDKGYSVIKGYFNEQLQLSKKFDAFCCFQVLEHIKEPMLFMQTLFNFLEEGGVGLINVPNGYSIIKEARYDQIISEHENYFTPSSLLHLAKNSGFEVLELNIDSEALELDLYITKHRSIGETSNYIGDKKRRDSENLKNQLTTHKKIAIWGAGQKTVSYSSLLPTDIQIKHLFDNDKNKEGFYVSGIPIPVEKPSKEKVQACDVILIFASSYVSEIKKTLKENYGFSGKIITIDV